MTTCPEIAAGKQDGLTFIGQGISLWPVGATCHNPVRNVSYVYETAAWLGPALLVVVALAVTFPLAWAAASRLREP